MTATMYSSVDGVDVAYVAGMVRICQLVPTIVTLYDHLITFDQEVELVWNKPWTIAKVLFFWNRYFGTFFLLAEAVVFSIKPSSDQVCRDWFFIQGWSTALIIWSMQSTMLFRTFAMFRRNRFVIISCIICYAIEVCTMVVIMILSFQFIDAINEPFPGIFICTPYNVPRYMYAFWLPIVVFDCVLFGLALWAGTQHVKVLHGLNSPRSSMWEVLLKDSLLYFSVTLTTYITSAVVWLVVPAHWLELPQGFSIAGTCVMGVRLVLNLRKAYYMPRPGDIELETLDHDWRNPSQVEILSASPAPSSEHSAQLQDVMFVKGDVLRRISGT
ncbi:hypothetical protein BDZ94DRAFT_548070 [Collybia nuda]|uniref:DUF6533 domain-containing protein n=1 Tax=Collybia nuda TaxID=64659 RepID=A0A9P5YHR7_9AGAR|nr:hypothetical protein BDZ94DRAFT_548070 [Collybia nuda]